MKITIKTEEKQDNIIPMCEMKPYQIGEIVESMHNSGYPGMIVMRTPGQQVMRLDIKPGDGRNIYWVRPLPDAIKVKLFTKPITLIIDNELGV